MDDKKQKFLERVQLKISNMKSIDGKDCDMSVDSLEESLGSRRISENVMINIRQINKHDSLLQDEECKHRNDEN